MDNSNESLYRKALYAAFSVFVLVMCAATTARALPPQSEARATTTSVSIAAKTEFTNEVTNLGRFVVTPSSASFISAPAETVWGSHRASQIERGGIQ